MCIRDRSALVDDGSCLYSVTFNVDMNCEDSTSFGFVHLESPVFGWCGGCVPMSDPDGDGVHSVTVDLAAGDFEYKYAVDNWGGQEDLVDDMLSGGTCAPVTDYSTYANRLVTVAAGLATADTYGSCDPCNLSNIPGCTDSLASNYDPLATVDDGSCLYSVTFNVDMNCEPAGSFGFVHLESPLFGWCGGCVPMSDPDGDGVHSVTIDLALGNFEYKYAVDNFSGQEDLLDDMLSGGTCAPVTDYFSYANRQVAISAGLTTSDTYGSCDPCVQGCTDPLALNFDSLALADDGSCIYPVDLSLQGIIDFTVPAGGSNGKAIHLVALQDISDLSIYGIGVANNGGGTDGQEYTFDSISVLAGDQILLARSPSDMALYFDSCYTQFDHVLTATSAISQNGDDAIELFLNDSVVETFGDINVDGTGECWEYMDSWAYKSAGDSTCLGGNWIFGGVNCTDGTTTTYNSSCPYPLCPLPSGCTDSLASNYDPSALVDDGSCLYLSLIHI